jgi:hypothetical protein
MLNEKLRVDIIFDIGLELMSGRWLRRLKVSLASRRYGGLESSRWDLRTDALDSAQDQSEQNVAEDQRRQNPPKGCFDSVKCCERRS